MPRIGQPQDDITPFIAQVANELYRRETDKQRRGVEAMQAKATMLNAAAQTLFAVGQQAGEVQLTPETQQRLFGEQLFPEIKGRGVKREQISQRQAEAARKRQHAESMEELKHQNRIKLNAARHEQTLTQIQERFDKGQTEAAQKMAWEYLKSLSPEADPGAGEVVKGKTLAAQIQDKPIPEKGKELEEPAAPPPGEVVKIGKIKLDFRGEAMTNRELLNVLGSEEKVDEMQKAYSMAQQLITQNPDLRKEYEKIFFEEYPKLKGKLGFKEGE